jgi:hypothetical protein
MATQGLRWTRVFDMACQPVMVAMSVLVATTSASASPPYSPIDTYARGSVVLAADGNEYRTLEVVTGKDPATTKGGPWRLSRAVFDTTLDVPGRFPMIRDAMQFIAGATIADDATVTVQLAPGRYEFGEPLTVGHRDRRRLLLKGAKDSTRVVLDFKQGGGLVISEQRGIRIEGLTLEGVRNDQIGIHVDHGSMLIASNIAINGFGLGFVADNGSELVADKVTVTTEDGSYGFKIESGSRGNLTECRAVRTKRDVLGGKSWGIDVQGGGTAACHSCYASGWRVGFNVGRCGSLSMWESEAVDNVWGGGVYLNATLSAYGCTFHKNGDSGISVHGGTGVLSDCEVRDNTKHGITTSCNGLMTFEGRSSVIAGHKAGLYAIGGRFYGVMPTFKDNEEKTEDAFLDDKNRADVFMLN